jgi:tetratricopeptide (TPR) repeat protein
MDAFQTLLKLSRDLQVQGCFVQAAKCLDAACKSSTALPANRAMACLDYSELLMDHFENLDLAKTLLLQAERELRAVRAHYGLKLEVFHLLIVCHRLSGDLDQALEACRAGLAAAQDPQAKGLMRWKVYFLLRMIECGFEKDKDAEAALTALSTAESQATFTPIETAVVALSRAALNLHCGRMDAADQQLTACATTLESIVGEEGDEGEVTSRLRGSYFLLYAATAMAVGRSLQLQQENDYPVFIQLQQALSSAGLEGNGWLPGPAAAALGYMMHGAVLRAGAKGSAAAVQLGQAEELVDQALSHLRLDLKKSENDVVPSVLVNGTVYLRLKVALSEQRALAALLSTDLASAARHSAEVVHLIQRFPSVLKDQASSACMLLAHYMHTLGEYDLALSLFDAVLHSSTKSLYKLAALSAAITELEKNSGDEGLAAAATWLEGQYLVPPLLQGLPSHEKAASQLVNGMVLKRKGDLTGSRLLLTKALKQAHGLIGCTQLVGQILNVLAPVQQERQDLSGAQQMFESATTLLKSVGDLPSLVTALNGMHALHDQEGNSTLVGKSQQYLARKATDLQGRFSEVKKSKGHSEVTEAAKWLLSSPV